LNRTGDRLIIYRHQNQKRQISAPTDYTSVLEKLRCPRFEERRDSDGGEIGREPPRIGPSRIQDGAG
jgi:hypothetical protein